MVSFVDEFPDRVRTSRFISHRCIIERSSIAEGTGQDPTVIVMGSWKGELDLQVASAESRTIGLFGKSLHQFLPRGRFAGKGHGHDDWRDGEICSVEGYLG